MDRVVITKPDFGIFFMQVCAVKEATDKEILEVCNTQNPSGTQNGWMKVIRNETGDMKNLNPVQCDDYKDRMHFIIEC